MDLQSFILTQTPTMITDGTKAAFAQENWQAALSELGLVVVMDGGEA